VKDRSSAAALRFAYRAAYESGASLDVITVDEELARPASIQLLGEALARQGEVVSDEIGLARLELPIYCDAVAGDPVDVLCGLAIGAGLLVIGGERHGRLHRRLHRSRVAQCADRAPCPLVIVRSDVAIPQSAPSP